MALESPPQLTGHAGTSFSFPSPTGFDVFSYGSDPDRMKLMHHTVDVQGAFGPRQTVHASLPHSVVASGEDSWLLLGPSPALVSRGGPAESFSVVPLSEVSSPPILSTYATAAWNPKAREWGVLWVETGTSGLWGHVFWARLNDAGHWIPGSRKTLQPAPNQPLEEWVPSNMVWTGEHFVVALWNRRAPKHETPTGSRPNYTLFLTHLGHEGDITHPIPLVDSAKTQAIPQPLELVIAWDGHDTTGVLWYQQDHYGDPYTTLHFVPVRGTEVGESIELIGEPGNRSPRGLSLTSDGVNFAASWVEVKPNQVEVYFARFLPDDEKVNAMTLPAAETCPDPDNCYAWYSSLAYHESQFLVTLLQQGGDWALAHFLMAP